MGLGDKEDGKATKFQKREEERIELSDFYGAAPQVHEVGFVCADEASEQFRKDP